jgi:dipeptidyl aminopeptidase/acylaminoacyl peptidase
MMTRTTIIALFLCVLSVRAAADEVLTHGSRLSVDAGRDASLVMDLSGSLWLVPPGGGEAEQVLAEPGGVTRPRLSPDGERVVFVANANGQRGLRIHSLRNGESQAIASENWLNLHPDWHPDGERVVFSSDRRGSGFDLWEVDVPTGLEWRLSNRPGDELEPAWSANGRDLVYVHHDGDQWSLVLRERGKPEEVLVTGTQRLGGPSWRPDGSLIMYWRHDDEDVSLDMVILSQPRLARRYMSGEAYSTAPVAWLDKHRMFYSAGGLIRQRLFNSWSSRTVPFRATIRSRPAAVVERVRRSLPRIDEPDGTLVVRAARLFDGIGGGYRHDQDIVIEGGRIAAIEDRADRPGAIVIDMGDLAVLPGLVDAHARLPDGTDAATGPVLLTAGVTTVVADH